MKMTRDASAFTPCQRFRPNNSIGWNQRSSMFSVMRTANPALKESVFTDVSGVGHDRMTINGTVNRTGFLILLVIAAAWFSWTRSAPGPGGTMAANPYIAIGALGGFV